MSVPHESRSLPDLIGGLASDISSLFRKEIELAKAEASEKVSSAVGGVVFIAAGGVLALGALGVMFRPLLFASVDAEVAAARGVPVRLLSVAFMVLLAITVSASVPVVGVLLIFALTILPTAAAQHLTPQPSHAIGLAVGLAITYVWAGLLVGFYLPYPPSFFITVFAFATFLAVRTLHPGPAR